MDMELITSNKKKLEEFKRILPEIKSRPGDDLREVEGTAKEVIMYKSLEAGIGAIVEDTILIINGEEVVDIKWKIDELKKLKPVDTIKASWQVMLGYNNGEEINIYRGIVNGIIIPDSKDRGYGFDPYFLPDGSDVTLARLEQEGRKDNFSARKNALISLKKDRPEDVIKIKYINEWDGEYQNN